MAGSDMRTSGTYSYSWYEIIENFSRRQNARCFTFLGQAQYELLTGCKAAEVVWATGGITLDEGMVKCEE